MGFEPTRAEPIGLAVQRLNHSAPRHVFIALWDDKKIKIPLERMTIGQVDPNPRRFYEL